jgi:hypothetical protein
MGKGTYGPDWPAYNAAQTNEKPQLLTVTAGRAFILRNKFLEIRAPLLTAYCRNGGVFYQRVVG